jgi:hypothetical protein
MRQPVLPTSFIFIPQWKFSGEQGEVEKTETPTILCGERCKRRRLRDLFGLQQSPETKLVAGKKIRQKSVGKREKVTT